MMKNFKK